jgi:CRISPR-associated protein (TIGR03984 family)
MTPGELTVFAATPTQFIVGARRNGTLRAPNHTPWTVPGACFQLTAFDPEMELRWLADSDGGTGVWVTESQALLPGPVTGSLNYFDRLSQRLILWGRPEPSDAGEWFSSWSQGRIGQAYYPCQPGTAATSRAALHLFEYVTVDDHGNAAVSDIRFTTITTLDEVASWAHCGEHASG